MVKEKTIKLELKGEQAKAYLKLKEKLDNLIIALKEKELKDEIKEVQRNLKGKKNKKSIFTLIAEALEKK